jgi:uncharacterized protein
MDSSTTQQPLSDDELNRLGKFLDGIGAPAMNMESLDGYFAALICVPDTVLPSKYLTAIWGEDFCFDDNGQATDILGLLMRHWNTISSELFRTLKEPEVYMPVLLEDDEGIAHGNDWARGFMRGVQARPASWRELIASDEHGGPLIPIMLLAHEHDPDPAMRPKPVAPNTREEILSMMIAGLTQIYRYFEPHRRSRASASWPAPLRREGRKIGRNEPCPCGSGLKYKRCCGSNTPTVH